MKNLKKILSLVLCLMMAAVLLTACGNKLKGEWELVDATDPDMVEAGATIILAFEDDEGSITFIEGRQSETEHFDYEVDGDTIIIEGEEAWGFKVKGKKLTLTVEGEKLYFERK